MGINNYSKKMSKLNAAYTKMRVPYLTDNPVCHANIHNCSIKATDIHHKQGRGLNHLNVDTWLPVCRNCHMWIEENTVEAIELGFSLPRTQENK
jgi:hypothetical protein|tara:strand:+ start:2326 stop:2607 length:282 start_codon:yes stop_codon:yes gene_type:complete